MTKFDKDWTKIVDFLLLVYFWASIFFFESVSIEFASEIWLKIWLSHHVFLYICLLCPWSDDTHLTGWSSPRNEKDKFSGKLETHVHSFSIKADIFG